MKCRQIEESLPLYVSGEITKRKGRKIGLHLEACPQCRREFETYLSLRVNLRELANLPGEGVLGGFYEALAPDLEAMGSPEFRVCRGATVLTLRRASLAAATLLIGLIVAYAFLDVSHHRGGGTPASDPDAVARGTDLDESLGPPEGSRVEPYRPSVVPLVEAPSVREAPIHRARLDPGVMILAGPRISVPLEPPALPVDIPIPKVRPYAWPVERPTTTTVQFH
jgi:hypothetical protein